MRTNWPADGTAFREGDEVVLAEGTYQGTEGAFVRFRQDANWADIAERNGRIRSHPVAWLAHHTGAALFTGLQAVKSDRPVRRP